MRAIAMIAAVLACALSGAAWCGPAPSYPLATEPLFGDELLFATQAGASVNIPVSDLTDISLRPAGSDGQIQFNNAGALGAFTFGGDCSLAQPTLTCTKTNGVNFGAFATQTNAANLTGTVPSAALPSPSSSTLGGVRSLAAVSHQWINTISTSGVPSATQPACVDVSNAGTACLANTGTSGAAIPFLNGTNTWSSAQTFSGGLTSSQYSIASTDTGNSQNGLIRVSDSTWSPSGAAGVFNNFDLSNITTSLTAGTVAQRWQASDNINVIAITTTGPAGSPGTPSGMADSHSVAGEWLETIPAGLCDGANGSGFGGAGGAPSNNCYQEIGGLENTATVLSPGHYAEGVGSAIADNSGGAGVAIRGNAFLAAINKANATNTYPLYAYYANSFGSQQTTNAPTAAFHLDGGWQVGIDLNGSSLYSGMIAINLPGAQTITSDATNIYLGVGATNAMTINATSSLWHGNLQVTGAVTPSQTGGIVGTTTNNNATAGSVGELLSNSTSGTSLTNLTGANATSVSLTAGDWDVECTTSFTLGGTTTATAFWSGINTTSATISATIGTTSVMEMPTQTGLPEVLASPVVRESLASTTTVYCVAQASFGVSTVTVAGFLRARRVR